MAKRPWIHGPLELLKHGLEHLQNGGDFDSRIALISIDNAVELMIKTYLGLPKRETRIEGLSRKEYDEISQSFPGLLDAIEKFAPEKMIGIELGDIEWFHRLRNQLYHEGNGITVEKGKVEGYAEIAKILFHNLFSLKWEDATGEEPTQPQGLIGKFFSDWAGLEKEFVRILNEKGLGQSGVFEPPLSAIKKLEDKKIFTSSYFNELDSVRQFRNQLAHGLTTPSTGDLKNYIASLDKLLKTAKNNKNK